MDTKLEICLEQLFNYGSAMESHVHNQRAIGIRQFQLFAR